METLVFQLAVAVLAPLLGGLATWAVSAFVKSINAKTGIAIDKAQEEKLQSAAISAINMAEEWAKNQVNKNNVKPTSEEKFDYAIDKMAAFIPDIKYADKALYVQAAVSKDPNIGATGGVEDEFC